MAKFIALELYNTPLCIIGIHNFWRGLETTINPNFMLRNK